MLNVISPDMLNRIKSLSERQMTIFTAYTNGLSSKEIACIKGQVCAIKTVESHLAQIKDRLGVDSCRMLLRVGIEFELYLKLNGLKIEEKKENTVKKYREFVMA